VKKKIILCGATGSIGKSALELVRKNPEKFAIVGATAHRNFAELKKIAAEFEIKNLLDTKKIAENFPKKFGEFLKKCDAEIAINAVSGFSGLKFSLEILRQKIPLALANKESIVAAGKFLQKMAAENSVPILPVDSEHSAIFQILADENFQLKKFQKIILTCSGGPFFGKNFSEIKNAKISAALAHPNWKMGAKISIDSATLANKCLEFFEAMQLFSARKNQIEIVIHRESIVHSAVEFRDGSIFAQLSPPSMQSPIAFALNFPRRKNCHLPRLDFSKKLNLSFFPPDKKNFPLLEIADFCAEKMENFPIIFNAANEILVENFLAEKINFGKIPEILKKIIFAEKLEKINSLEKIFEIDKKIREKTRDEIAKNF